MLLSRLILCEQFPNSRTFVPRLAFRCKAGVTHPRDQLEHETKNV